MAATPDTTRTQRKQWKQPSVWAIAETDGGETFASSPPSHSYGRFKINDTWTPSFAGDANEGISICSTGYFYLLQRFFLLLSTRRSRRCSLKAEWVPPLPCSTSITVIKTNTKKAAACHVLWSSASCRTKTSSQRATSVGESGGAAEGRGNAEGELFSACRTEMHPELCELQHIQILHVTARTNNTTHACSLKKKKKTQKMTDHSKIRTFCGPTLHSILGLNSPLQLCCFSDVDLHPTLIYSTQPTRTSSRRENKQRQIRVSNIIICSVYRDSFWNKNKAEISVLR